MHTPWHISDIQDPFRDPYHSCTPPDLRPEREPGPLRESLSSRQILLLLRQAVPWHSQGMFILAYPHDNHPQGSAGGTAMVQHSPRLRPLFFVPRSYVLDVFLLLSYASYVHAQREFYHGAEIWIIA